MYDRMLIVMAAARFPYAHTAWASLGIKSSKLSNPRFHLRYALPWGKLLYKIPDQGGGVTERDVGNRSADADTRFFRR